MEPFGLLNLLSALLPKTQETPSAAPKNTPENGEISKEKTDDSTAQTPLQAPLCCRLLMKRALLCIPLKIHR